MRKQKKTMTSILLAALLGVLAIGGTLAYLSTKTETKVNNFTFLGSDDISAALTEPTWEAGRAADANYGKNLTPGAEIGKDPIITNTCGLDEYVATRVSFQKGDGTILTPEEYIKLMTMIEIDWSSQWTAAATAAPVTIYNYNTKLIGAEGTDADPFKMTAALFTKVKVKDTLVNTDLEWLKTNIGGFNIKIEGAAIQGSEFADLDAAKADLNALFN